MGIEIELFALLVIQLIGTEVFARFEIETPAWRKVLKWSLVIGLILGLYSLIGHWSLVILLGLSLTGTVTHFVWCHKNGIHPLHATPRRRYYELRGWKWVE